VYSKGKHYRQTANGYQIKAGDRLIAAPPEIPFGTWITVPGYGRAQVLDRGGAIKGKRLDLYFPTHQEALNWGRQHIEVTF
jgi:3D (Asp-Asp-Asp) domain-containing protein